MFCLLHICTLFTLHSLIYIAYLYHVQVSKIEVWLKSIYVVWSSIPYHFWLLCQPMRNGYHPHTQKSHLDIWGVVDRLGVLGLVVMIRWCSALLVSPPLGHIELTFLYICFYPCLFYIAYLFHYVYIIWRVVRISWILIFLLKSFTDTLTLTTSYQSIHMTLFQLLEVESPCQCDQRSSGSVASLYVYFLTWCSCWCKMLK